MTKRESDFKYRHSDKGKLNATKRRAKYVSTEKGKHYVKAHARRGALKKKYGITLEQYNEMLAGQLWGCAICGKSASTERYRVLSVDHNHHTGKVRGLLCVKCNSNLGWYEDGRVNILNYLQEQTGVQL